MSPTLGDIHHFKPKVSKIWFWINLHSYSIVIKVSLYPPSATAKTTNKKSMRRNETSRSIFLALLSRHATPANLSSVAHFDLIGYGSPVLPVETSATRGKTPALFFPPLSEGFDPCESTMFSHRIRGDILCSDALKIKNTASGIHVWILYN